MLAAALLLALAAEPQPTVVLVSRRTAVSATDARALASDCSTQLAAAGVPLAFDPDAALKQLSRLAVKDSASCNGRKACLAELGRQLGVTHLVLLSVATLDRETSLGLELLRVADETVVATDSLFITRKGALDGELLAPFLARVKDVLVPPPPPSQPVQPPDVPREPTLVPTPPPPEVPVAVVVAPPVPPRSHTASWVLGGAGVAALVASGALLAVGLSTRDSLTRGELAADGRVHSTLTAAEAQQLNTTSWALFIGAAGAAAAGLGLGTAAVFTW